MASPNHSSQKLFGTFTRKERWGLSWRGWLLLVSAGLVAACLVFLNIHPFLAVTHRVNTNLLVVEGWIPRYALREAAEEFRTGSYQRIFTTGGPVEGGYTNDYNTSASVGAEILKKFGVPDDRDGSFARNCPRENIQFSGRIARLVTRTQYTRDSINVLTEDAHARRTRLLYHEAFGKSVTVGIIAVANPDYNSTKWWHYSDGVREVIGESIAYIYARFFFYPSASPSHKEAAQTAAASR